MKKNTAEIVFSILIMCSLFFCVFGFFCGGEIIECWFTVSSIFGGVLVSVVLYLFVKIRFSEKDSKEVFKNWVIYNHTITSIEPTQIEYLAIIDSKITLSELQLYRFSNLQELEIYSDDYTIGKNAFIGCQKLKKIILHNKPNDITNSELKTDDCLSLEQIIFIGKDSEWNDIKTIKKKQRKIEFIVLNEKKNKSKKNKKGKGEKK